MEKVYLRPRREDSILRFHPWVFSGAIAHAQVTGTPAEGDLVGVYSSEGEYLATGHYQIGSIAVRILSFDEDPLAPDFWEKMVRRAFQMRVNYGLHGSASTNCYRLSSTVRVTAFPGSSSTIMTVSASSRPIPWACSRRKTTSARL